MKLVEEEHIIARVLEGDTNAFGSLVHQYKNLVFTLCVKMLHDKGLAEDVAQESFVKAFQQLSKFNGKSKFSSWLYRIAYNNCVDAIKKEKKHLTATIEEEKIGGIDSYSEGVSAREKAHFIQKALHRLEEEDRAIMTLYYYQSASVAEIAETLGISESNVKIKLHRSRKSLKKVFERNKEFLDI